VSIGLAAMLGTGVFAAWTPALRWAGRLLLVSLLVAAFVASLNAWSPAALARVHPEAGGAYAYGRIRLGRPAGLVAGTAFVL
ncbi:amino acid permease, partial [Acinetobacter baumannii]